MTNATSALTGAPAGRRGAAMQWSWRESLVVAIAVVMLALHLLVWNGAIGARGGLDRYVRGIDFMATLTGARVIRDGAGALLYDVDTQRATQERVRAPYLTTSNNVLLPYIHPPFEALLIAPLIDLPYPVLYALSTLAAILSVGLALWLLARVLPIPGPARWIVILVACSYSPFHQALWLGQTSPFMLLGWCAAYALFKRRRDLSAGASLALLVLKPLLLPIPALLLVVRWRLRAVIGLLGAIAGLSLAAMPVLGVTWIWRQWQFLTLISSLPDRNAIYPESMPTFRGLAVNLIGNAVPALIMPLEVVLGAATIGLFLLACWRSRHLVATEEASGDRGTPATDLVWALACVVAVLVPPHLGPHDHTLLLFPLWIVSAHLLSGRWPEGQARLWLALLWGNYLLGPLNLFIGLPTSAATVANVLILVAAAAFLTWQLGASAGHVNVPRGLVRES